MTTYLDKAKDLGIRNIFALRGDAPSLETAEAPHKGTMRYGSDLVRHIKRHYPEDFTICVAGYPGGHPEALSYEEDLVCWCEEQLN